MRLQCGCFRANTNWKSCQGFLFLEWAEWKQQQQIPSSAQKWKLLELEAQVQIMLSSNFDNASACVEETSLSAGARAGNSVKLLDVHIDYENISTHRQRGCCTPSLRICIYISKFRSICLFLTPHAQCQPPRVGMSSTPSCLCFSAEKSQQQKGSCSESQASSYPVSR